MPRLLTAVIAIGAAWGLVARGVHLAMFSGAFSPPADLPLPFAIALLLLDLPLLAALYLETALARSSPTLNEVTALAVLCGAVIATAVATVLRWVRRSSCS